MSGRSNNVVVLGDGGWGTALAVHLARKGVPVWLWGAFPDYLAGVARSRINEKFLQGIKIPDNVNIESNATTAISCCDVVVCAIPTKYIRCVTQQFSQIEFCGKSVLSVSKGLEIHTLKRPSVILCEELKVTDVAVLSGPSHAEEVARGKPASVVVCAQDHDVAVRIQRLFMNDTLRIYTNQDIVGVEMGGALKNIIGIAAGICDGMGLGDNAKSALITRGLTEIARFGMLFGAHKETFTGLSGIGDLMTTCFSEHGRNRYVGMQLGSGRDVQEVLGGMTAVAEGVTTAKAVFEYATQHEVSMPITEQVYRILYENKKPMDALRDLMRRSAKMENEDSFLK